MQDGLFAIDHEGMAGVVSSLKANNHIGVSRKQIDDLPLTLVAPLKAYDRKAVEPQAHPSVQLDHASTGDVGHTAKSVELFSHQRRVDVEKRYRFPFDATEFHAGDVDSRLA